MQILTRTFVSIVEFHKDINKIFLFFSFSPQSSPPPGTIFLFFTLNAFCTFYMLSLKSFAIFQLIEKANWIFLSGFGVFSLCISAETTNKAINDCTTLLNAMFSHDACESINQKLDVCWKTHGWSFFMWKAFSLFIQTDWNHLYKDHRSKRFVCFHLWIFWYQHEIAAFVCLHVNHFPGDFIAVQLWLSSTAYCTWKQWNWRPDLALFVFCSTGASKRFERCLRQLEERRLRVSTIN